MVLLRFSTESLHEKQSHVKEIQHLDYWITYQANLAHSLICEGNDSEYYPSNGKVATMPI
jgi:hypothetical protein